MIGAKFFMQAGQDVTVGGRLTQTSTSTRSPTPIPRSSITGRHHPAADGKLPELQDVASDQQIASPHVAINIDRNAAYRLGLSLAQIDQTLYDAFGQRQVAHHLHLKPPI